MLEGLEFLNSKQAIWGGVGLLFWLIDYFRLGKKAELKLPPNYQSYLKKINIRSLILVVLAIVAWGLISIALMGPRKPVGKTNATKEINDIYFVVDVSRSMLAEDFLPNRLEAAKKQISKFVELSPVDRIGIIMFADKVFTLIPATMDLELVNQSVSQIDIGFLGSGTNIGDALGLAIARSASSIAENKSIVLLTDGASNVGLMSPQQAAKEAKEVGIKIHTIGIGGDKNAKLPTGRDVFGRKRYQNIPGGSMDFPALVEISEISGGKSFVASNQDALQEILAEINELERKGIDISGKVIYEELYWPFLFAGAIFLLLVEVIRKFVFREVQ